MSQDAAAAYLRDIARTFRNYKALGEKALAQTPDEALHAELDANSNSIAVVVKHVSGNLRSRFRDFLTTDGEKPDRNRDGEFQMPEHASRAQVVQWWDDGWSTALGAVDALTPDDLTRTIHIRGEAFLVVEALNRSITHTAYHVGQIVYLARHSAGPAWKSLTIPKGESAKHAVGEFKSKGLVR
ncbi:MAG TPA: DinB family protein [Vicinamibacterales bacterium]|nr:DinB family protein [Vicinamibacterales bacterium]